MPADYASSIQAVALRVTSLTPTGAPLAGPDTSYTTSKFTRVSFTPEYEDGDEIQEKAANGDICIYYKMADVLKQTNVEVAICNPQPELTMLLAGGNTIVGADVLGYKAPITGQDPDPDGCGIEVWSRAITGGKPAAVNPFWRWVFPHCRFKFSGERAMENGAMGNAFEGQSNGNAAFDTGPSAPDWPYGTDRSFQYARVGQAPTGINGYTTVA